MTKQVSRDNLDRLLATNSANFLYPTTHEMSHALYILLRGTDLPTPDWLCKGKYTIILGWTNPTPEWGDGLLISERDPVFVSRIWSDSQRGTILVEIPKTINKIEFDKWHDSIDFF